MDSSIFVTAELKIQDGIDREQTIKAIEQFCLDMQSEEGCLQATASYDSEDLQRVILWERYQDKAAIQAHFVMPHTQAFIDRGLTTLVQVFQTQCQSQSQ
ncbi:putative quinol monooxygenase, partial [Vibrio gallaecicus]